jgi:ribosomal protein S18 acetylase RimI-like enzyme
MIRATTPEDTPFLIELSEGTGVFSGLDMGALHEVLAEYHAAAHAEGHRAVTCEQDGQVIGFAYFAPAAMTERTWYLWWIVVTKQIQARGVGSVMLRHVEEAIRAAGGRLLLLETSSLPSYELTRRFYLKNSYEVAAILKDYYADGNDMFVFRKRLAPPG